LRTFFKVYDIGGRNLCNYSGFTMIFFGIASMAMVFLMAIERFIAIQYALFYKVRKILLFELFFLCWWYFWIILLMFWLFQTKVTVCGTRITIVFIILFLLVISALPLLGFGEIEQQFPGTWCFLHWKSRKPVNQVKSKSSCLFSNRFLLTFKFQVSNRLFSQETSWIHLRKYHASNFETSHVCACLAGSIFQQVTQY